MVGRGSQLRQRVPHHVGPLLPLIVDGIVRVAGDPVPIRVQVRHHGVALVQHRVDGGLVGSHPFDDAGQLIQIYRECLSHGADLSSSPPRSARCRRTPAPPGQVVRRWSPAPAAPSANRRAIAARHPHTNCRPTPPTLRALAALRCRDHAGRPADAARRQSKPHTRPATLPGPHSRHRRYRIHSQRQTLVA